MWTWDCNFFDKNSPFLPGCTFKLAGKNWIEGGPGPLVFHIVVSYCCKRKILKRNWRNNRLFRHIFVIGEISIERETRAPCPPPPWLRLCSKWGKQKRCSQIFRGVSGVFQWNFNCSKNSAVLEPRTGQFSRIWGFEAKDLTFEAKAKDFKICPRGQGRPRGLHLCKILLWNTKPDDRSPDKLDTSIAS